MRSVWKGHIRFSLVTIPVQIFNAVETKGNISFKQLHAEDNGAVGYKKYCKSCDVTLGRDDIVKGYEYQPDQFVIISSDELKNIKLKSTRAIDIEAFVDIDEVSPSRYEAVYYVGPEGDVAKGTFALLCETLKKTGKAGIGRIILRDREDVVLLTVPKDKPGLIMYKLRYDYEIRDIEKVPDIGDNKGADEAQLKLAMQLVDSLSTKFSEVDFTDRYKGALNELVEQKVAGKEIINIDIEEDAPVVDIMSALKKSIEESKKKSA